MESWIEFFYQNAQIAHYIIFFCLIAAGFNVPISEDLMIIIAASLAASAVPEHTYILFFATFLGCYLSDWISYWIGRKFGRKLWAIPWFAKTIPEKRLIQTQNFYQKYGFFTLLVGRFIPFGVRNCLFISAGMGKMPFHRFLISDGIACALSNTTLFCLTYLFNKNIHLLLTYLKRFNIALFLLFIVTIIGLIWYKRRKQIDLSQKIP